MVTLLSLQLDNSGQELEAAGPSWNSLVIEVLLSDDDLLVEELLVLTSYFFPANVDKDIIVRHVVILSNNLLFLSEHGLVVRVAGFRLFEDRLRVLLKLLHQLNIVRQDRTW